MDPDKALEGLRELVDAYNRDDVADPLAHVEMLVESFEALDEWLSKGGHAPSAWPLVVMAR